MFWGVNHQNLGYQHFQINIFIEKIQYLPLKHGNYLELRQLRTKVLVQLLNNVPPLLTLRCFVLTLPGKVSPD